MITISSKQGSYPVRFGALKEIETRVAIVDENVDRLWQPDIPTKFIVPSGESSKSPATFTKLCEWLAESTVERGETIAVIGGGVTGDLGGFAAAAYMRGIPYIQVPTTLLAMVDSSVGGKVGINLEAGKNLVGAFYPPTEVVIPVEVLETLPPRQMKNGMAEVLKYGFIIDSELLGQVRRGVPIDAIIERCVRCKARIVEEDEFESNGRRAILNFGHTVGHALEWLTGYDELLHGEAVSIGMFVEARLGERIGFSEGGTRLTVEKVLISQGLPTTHVLLKEADKLIEAMYRDKKAKAGKLGFSLLTHVGECKLTHAVTESDLRSALLDK